VEKLVPQFQDRADFTIRFQPFQLYPDLPPGDNDGVDKVAFFKDLHTKRNGGVWDPDASAARFARTTAAWAEEGITLAPRGGNWGQSFDAQRLISFARKQGREHEMVEEIYHRNHTQNKPLSEYAFLIAAAERAGVKGVTEEWLEGDAETWEVKGKIQKHIDMGISAVPVLVINDRQIIHGAPEQEDLANAFAKEIKKGPAI